MKSRILILLIVWFASVASYYSFAEQTIVSEQGESSYMSDSKSEYVHPTSVHDTLITSDSILVIHTVCAPICSSRVRVYNKEWQEIGILRPPFRSVFPEAYIEDGKLLWRDNDTFDYTPCR